MGKVCESKFQNVHYGTEGSIAGFYDNDIHVTIPTPSIKIIDVVWLELTIIKENT